MAALAHPPSHPSHPPSRMFADSPDPFSQVAPDPNDPHELAFVNDETSLTGLVPPGPIEEEEEEQEEEERVTPTTARPPSHPYAAKRAMVAHSMGPPKRRKDMDYDFLRGLPSHTKEELADAPRPPDSVSIYNFFAARMRAETPPINDQKEIKKRYDSVRGDEKRWTRLKQEFKPHLQNHAAQLQLWIEANPEQERSFQAEQAAKRKAKRDAKAQRPNSSGGGDEEEEEQEEEEPSPRPDKSKVKKVLTPKTNGVEAAPTTPSAPTPTKPKPKPSTTQAKKTSAEHWFMFEPVGERPKSAAAAAGGGVAKKRKMEAPKKPSKKKIKPKKVKKARFVDDQAEDDDEEDSEESNDDEEEFIDDDDEEEGEEEEDEEETEEEEEEEE